MPRKFGQKKIARKRVPRKSAPRRRLQTGAILAGAGLTLAKRGYNKYQQYKLGVRQAQHRQYLKSAAARQSRLDTADGIVKLRAQVFGKPRAPTFEERVAKVDRPPLQFKRNYQFNAEGYSGRKAWFSFEINMNNGNDLLNDTNVYKQQYYTDTATADATGTSQSLQDQSRFYIDYQSEKMSIINSSSNSVSGKIHLFAHRRDNDNVLHTLSVPLTVINLMAYYSTGALPLLTTASEATVGNGFKFDTATAGSNYNSVYNMPGSSINSSGVCLSTDPTLSPMSSHIKESINYWFRKVSTESFTLKPGQQMDKSYIWHDLPQIFKEQMDYIHLAGITFSVVVEFMGGIVGDGTTTTGDGVVSTGTTQLSCIRHSTRIIGVRTKLRPKICQITAPLNSIALAQQLTINPDTGVSDTGVELDT